MGRRKSAELSSPIAEVGFACRDWIFEGVGGKQEFQGRPWVYWLFRHKDGRQMIAPVPEGWQHTEMAVVERVIALDMQAQEQALFSEYARMC